MLIEEVHTVENGRLTTTKTMENGGGEKKKNWCFGENTQIDSSSEITIRGILSMLMGSVNDEKRRPIIPLGHGDPSAFPCFRTSKIAEDSIVDSLRSALFNSYAPTVGLLPTRRAVADFLSHDLPYKLSPDDVFITLGCTQAIETSLTALARPGSNILLPKPGFPYYESVSAFTNLQIRRFDLLPDKGWEVDLDAVETLADENTVAIVLINPGNPCGTVYSYQHLKKIAETARKLGILVIADEVYGHLTYGSKPFIPMGVFASIVPVITLGSISKRWIAPGWRIGWLVTNDPNGILKERKVVESIKGYLNVNADPPTFIQAALPQILANTNKDFFDKIISLLKNSLDILYNELKEIDCLTCPHKPEGSMFAMVKVNLDLMEDINDDMDFCFKLAKEESVIILPGTTVGLKNWLRITFAVESTSLSDGMARLKAFCQRHTKQQ